MDDREQCLRRLAPGDIFHGHGASGASLICLVVEVDGKALQARRITTQELLSFDRHTGAEIGGSGIIRSVEPLPDGMHDTLLGLDRRYARGGPNDEHLKLTEAERDVLLHVGDYYAAHPI